MYAIPPELVEHPDEVAAYERLRAIALGPLQKACNDWMRVMDRLGRGEGNDEYYDEVVCQIDELEQRLSIGREGRDSRPESLKEAREGNIVPVFDSDGNPVVLYGEQMYTTPERAKMIEAAIVAVVRWLEHEPDPAIVKFLFLRPGGPPELHYVMWEATRIRRGDPP